MIDGLKERDFFAGMALAGLLARTNPDSIPSIEQETGHIASLAYRLADDMLAERDESGE